MHTPVVDRRVFLLGASAMAALAPLLAGHGAAQDGAPGWQDAVKAIAGDARPTTDGRFTFELPDIAENGNMVPFAIGVTSPMTEKDHVKAIHIVATANPLPGVATFRFTPLSGRASVSGRLRLARSQDLIGLAELSDGKLLMARQAVKVAIGGCGS